MDQGDPLEAEMAAHPSVLAWETSWTKESEGHIGSIGSQRVGHDRAHGTLTKTLAIRNSEAGISVATS